MLVSWDWLKQYVAPNLSADEVTRRLMMSGLNHEETTQVADDLAINLEVTSNRPDCLGHIGIAREIAVLLEVPLTIPAARPVEGKASVNELTKVRIDSPQACPRYTARVVRGVKVKSSPAWLVKRLQTIGVAAINNVVDITNYVLMECGQPLHAFDLAKLGGRQIIVRMATAGEPFEAINHKTYNLDGSMCVIADAQRPVALAGVMGGASTEVSATTTELIIESAEFDPVSIRNTARKLNLHSDSSYRFERALDPEGVDWASRRACELILELAGGELAAGVIDVGRGPTRPGPITLRFSQLPRILGIDVPAAEVRRILSALGNQEVRADADRVEVIPPSWRRDLSREIDLVEEVARIHGYEKIPEDVSVPMATSHRTVEDRVLGKVRQALTAAGFDEAVTLSAVDESLSESFSPWSDVPALVASTPVLRRADRLRRSLIPSLLDARHTNQSLANPRAELFEIARVYLPSSQPGELPREEIVVSMTSGEDFLYLKGAVESVVASLNPSAALTSKPTSQKLLDADRSAELRIVAPGTSGDLLGYLGEVSGAGLKQFDLRSRATVAEIKLSTLLAVAQLVPQFKELPAYPAVSRDLNLVVDEAICWADVANTVNSASQPYAEQLQFQDVYRDPQRLGEGKKSLLMTLVLRSRDATLTNEQADAVREKVVAACHQAHGAKLRA